MLLFVDVVPVTAYPVVPLLATMSPHRGSTVGGTKVTLTGGAFVRVKRVVFGTTPARNLRVLSRSRITVRSPRHLAGPVRVRVINHWGIRSSGLRFMYYRP
jgi:cytochrome c